MISEGVLSSTFFPPDSNLGLAHWRSVGRGSKDSQYVGVSSKSALFPSCYQTVR